jgi:hypothetical protein
VVDFLKDVATSSLSGRFILTDTFNVGRVRTNQAGSVGPLGGPVLGVAKALPPLVDQQRRPLHSWPPPASNRVPRAARAAGRIAEKGRRQKIQLT